MACCVMLRLCSPARFQSPYAILVTTSPFSLMASRTAPISKCRLRVLLTPISMLSKSMNTAIFNRSSTKDQTPKEKNSHKKAQKHKKFFSYFLKRLSKALRASEGLIVGPPLVPPPESRVSRSMEVRAMKNSHLLRRSFFVIRSGISCVHSNRAAVSKWRQFLQERRSALHLGHWLSRWMSTGGGTIVPHNEQRRTS